MWNLLYRNGVGKYLERFTKGTETRKVCTTDWEVVPHIDYPTAKKSMHDWAETPLFT